MGVTGIGGAASLSLQAALAMRSQLDDLQRQLGTGKKSTTYAGLGLDRGLTVGLRSRLSAISGYQQTITLLGVRLDVMQTALAHISSVAEDTKTRILQSQFVLHGDTQTQDQKSANTLLDQLVGLLNADADGRYLFSGRSVDQPPVVAANVMLDGDGLRAGLRQMIDERRLADLGAGGLGRLTVGVGVPTPTTVALAEDAVSPFGFKLIGATATLTGATVTAPAGSPPAMTVDLGATNPNDGETIRFSFTLPDGSTRDITLTATASATPGAGQFAIGATSDVTAANLETALTQALGTLAGTELVAASAVAAGRDFFNTDAGNPPQRVDGPPFDTATALIDGTGADTVNWYVGDNATDDPRGTALARADQSLTVSYGVRANEHALSVTVQSFAVFAAMTFSGADPNAEGQYVALRQRIGGALVGTANEQKISDIQGELAGAQIALKSAKDRHQQTDMTLQNLLQSVEGATPEEVATQILALQTRLQATLQTTAMLLQTNLLNYI
jgi:flagellin-like hook-associated protein FlgL